MILALWYGTVLLLTAGVGAVLGQRLSEPQGRVAGIAVVALLAFLALVLQWTEFVCICLTDVTLFLRPSC
jgi:hypothetical protein